MNNHENSGEWVGQKDFNFKIFWVHIKGKPELIP